MEERLTSTLAGGWKQRLASARALLHRQKSYFSANRHRGRPITRASFWGTIKKIASLGVTVFVTTHYMDEAENTNRMVLIYRGTIIAMGTPSEMKTKCMANEVLEITLGNSQDWLERISKIPGVKEAALFGANIHTVVYDSSKAKAAMTV